MRRDSGISATPCALAVAAALAAYASAAFADPIINGVNLSGFSTVDQVAYTKNAGKFGSVTVATGSLYLSTDAQGDVFFAFVQPIGINNNAFGSTATSGYNTDPEFNWPYTTSRKTGTILSGHSLSDLLASDQVNFDFLSGSSSLKGKAFSAFNFNFDYAADDPHSTTKIKGRTYPNPYPYSAIGTCGDNTYRTSKNGISTCAYSQQDDGKVNVGRASWLLQYATSLSYDCALDPSYCGIGIGSTVDSPTPAQDPRWVNTDIYEGEISAAAFGKGGFGGVDILSVNNSPSELSYSRTYCIGGTGVMGSCGLTSVLPTASVPDPNSASLLGIGLLSLFLTRLAWWRRRWRILGGEPDTS